jgi:hypothetical protein
MLGMSSSRVADGDDTNRAAGGLAACFSPTRTGAGCVIRPAPHNTNRAVPHSACARRRAGRDSPWLFRPNRTATDQPASSSSRRAGCQEATSPASTWHLGTMYLGTLCLIAFLGLDDFVPPPKVHRPPKAPASPHTRGWGLFHRASGMAFDPRRSGFIEAVRVATIAVSFGMVGYIVFFH